jgi:hypothetical protein
MNGEKEEKDKIEAEGSLVHEAKGITSAQSQIPATPTADDPVSPHSSDATGTIISKRIIGAVQEEVIEILDDTTEQEGTSTQHALSEITKISTNDGPPANDEGDDNSDDDDEVIFVKEEKATDANATTIAMGRTSAKTRKRRRTRKSALSANQEVYDYEDGEQTLRFAASKVAAICGLHPYMNPEEVVEMIIDHVYQDLPYMLEQDAAFLKLTIKTEQEELQELLQKSKCKELKRIVELTELPPTKATTTTKTVQLQKTVDKLIRGNKQLQSAEGVVLAEKLRRKLYTNYGDCNESLAIQLYEEQQGCQVESRNDSWYTLEFLKPPSATTGEDSSTGETSPPHYEQWMRRKVTQRKQRSLPPSSDVSEIAHETKTERRRERQLSVQENSNVLFRICGAVDGITHVLQLQQPNPKDVTKTTPPEAADNNHHKDENGFDADDDEWTFEPMVVEVKNRVGRFQDPIQLFEEIQTLVYMKMLDCHQADLVQCMTIKQTINHKKKRAAKKEAKRCGMEKSGQGSLLDHWNKDKKEEKKNQTDSDTKADDSSPIKQMAQIKVTRIDPYAHPLHTAQAWHNELLPRLYQFADTIYKFRSNAMQRLALLNGTPQQQRDMLEPLLHFLL